MMPETYVKPDRPCDYKRKHEKYWFEEMLVEKDDQLSPLMVCPVTGQLLICRMPSGWYAITSEVNKAFKIWVADTILLG